MACSPEAMMLLWEPTEPANGQGRGLKYPDAHFQRLLPLPGLQSLAINIPVESIPAAVVGVQPAASVPEPPLDEALLLLLLLLQSDLLGQL